MVQKYTLGFVFNNDLTKVLLIHKLTPAWQNGKVNGPGGKVEGDDNGDSLKSIVREIKEETDLTTTPEKWHYVGRHHSPTFDVDTFSYVYEGKIEDAKSMEAQQIEWFDVSAIPENVIPNLKWLIPMALEKVQDPKFKSYNVEYS
jgi:8-oxo-dGTP diphosphatase